MKARNITIDDLAAAMRLSKREFWYRVRHVKDFFKEAREERIKGKMRSIRPPKPSFKRELRGLLRFLQRACPPHAASHGGVRGRSCFTAARGHLGKKIVVVRDAEDCYPSITTEAVETALTAYGMTRVVAYALARLMTVDGSMPQGSPLSNLALNLVLHRTDRALAATAKGRGMSYHRMCDDMVMSTDNLRLTELPGRLMEAQIERVGLVVNEGKRKRSGLQRRHRRQMVHNLDVSSRRGVRIRKERQISALRMAESYVRGCGVVGPESLEALALKRRRILGYVYHFRQAEFSNTRHLRKLVDAGDRKVVSRLRSAGLSAPRNKWWAINWNGTGTGKNRPRQLAAIWRRRFRGAADTGS